MKVEIRLVVLSHCSKHCGKKFQNTYSGPLIQWVSVERSLRCVNSIDFQPHSKRAKERKTNPVSFFFATIVDNNWHFYSTKTRLRAVSQCWVRGTVETRFNEVTGYRPNLLVKWRVRFIVNLDLTNLRIRPKCSLHQDHS